MEVKIGVNCFSINMLLLAEGNFSHYFFKKLNCYKLYTLRMTIGALVECFWMIYLPFVPASIIQNNYFICTLFIFLVISNIKIKMF
ncbi:hypothetical protein BIY37_05030 [Candidatus Brocadia sapporoensis]|uniref:Uncharacterized protein n=1 Tax=Candidatus Brocadia sapporoensis TaxID=392547 RepID=A0A1V6M189_9BACT|nr:hypothetical protein BIY37_05030 [Candidatus Brocadia sapporoensis]